MFTTGSKLFLGATVLSVVGAIVIGSTVGGQGTIIALITASAIFAFLAGINFFINDGNVSSMEPDATVNAAANTPPSSPSIWPFIAVLGVAFVVVGFDTRAMFVVIGILILILAAFQWLMQGWSDRATADRAHNAQLRSNLLGGLNFPLSAAVGLGLVVFSFSRIMLWIDKAGGPVVFILAAVLIVVGGYLVASKPNLRKGMFTGIAAIVGLGLVSTGAVMAIDGQRKIEPHATTFSEPAVCNEPGKDPHVDKRAPQDVTIKASLAAHVRIKDGNLAVYSQGLRGARPDVTLARGTVNNILFINEDNAPRRFRINMGEFTEKTGDTETKVNPVMCTTLVPEGGQALLTVKFERPSIASAVPYTITALGVDDQAITVLVP